MRTAAIFVAVVLTVVLVVQAGAQSPATTAPASTAAGKKTRTPTDQTYHKDTGGKASSTDSVASSLNAKELSTLQAGGPNKPPPGPTSLVPQGNGKTPPASVSPASVPVNTPPRSQPVPPKGTADDICDIVTGCTEPSH